MQTEISEVDTSVLQLMKFRRERCFPVRIRRLAREIGEATLALLFPHFSDSLPCDEAMLAAEVDSLRKQLSEIQRLLSSESLPDGVVDEFISRLPGLHQALTRDAEAIQEGDPAAANFDEVVVAYPGFYAIAIYRIAHVLCNLGFPLLPRLLTEYAHRETGIDIHPGATIGRGFVIDHGTGVVIGETAHIGNGVKLYQGVTLGALAVRKEFASTKRHPTIEDNVIVYANATILGGDTVVGHDAVIGGNAFVTSSIPPFSSVSRSDEIRPRKTTIDAPLEFYI